MDPLLTVTANGRRFCVFCMKELNGEEECHCKGADKARLKAQKKAEKKAQNLPDHKHDLPPRHLPK